MSGQSVTFPVNGTSAGGYLATPSSAPAPGVLVLQEWWGLLPQIKRMCDRFAEWGFVALAPDLYHGDLAEHTEMDKAGDLMTNLPPERAARDMSGAIDYLLGRDDVSGSAVGVVGFCMGGLLTLRIAAIAGSKVAAAAPFYGAPLGDDSLDWSNLYATVEGHFASNDDFFGPEPVKALESQLTGLGKDVTFHVYPDSGHAFANEDDPLGNYHAEHAKTALDRTVALFRAKLS